MAMNWPNSVLLLPRLLTLARVASLGIDGLHGGCGPFAKAPQLKLFVLLSGVNLRCIRCRDGEVPNRGKYAACQRAARTIYLGSAPTATAAHRGLEGPAHHILVTNWNPVVRTRLKSPLFRASALTRVSVGIDHPYSKESGNAA